MASSPLAADPPPSPSPRFILNERYKKEEFKNKFRLCLEGKHEDSTPFPHFYLIDFLTSSDLISDLRKELNSSAWMPKNNDLYSLHQTVDIENFRREDYPVLFAFRQFMLEEVRRWLIFASGVQLSGKLALSGSRYSNGDCLLVHDDRLEGRAFAFVLYLSPNWTEADGGDLCLYNTEPTKNHPVKVVKRFRPVENSFSLFRVQNNSWHSVAEILSKGRDRLSLNGWFHYPPGTAVALPGEIAAPEERLPRLAPAMTTTLAEVTNWVNSNYIGPVHHRQIRRIFASESQIALRDFLNPHWYTAALEELESADFRCVGPPHKRKVWRLLESTLPENCHLRSLFRLFRSEAMTLLLTQWTGLRLHDLGRERDDSPISGGGSGEDGSNDEGPPEKKSKDLPSTSKAVEEEEEEEEKRSEIITFVNRIEHGCYSMADDQMLTFSNTDGYSLDVLLFFGRKSDWLQQNGGFVTFFDSEKELQLLDVLPVLNSAAVVFREPGVLSFTKYVNNRAGNDRYYVLCCTYVGVWNGEGASDSLGSSPRDPRELVSGNGDDIPIEEEEEGEEREGEGDGEKEGEEEQQQ